MSSTTIRTAVALVTALLLVTAGVQPAMGGAATTADEKVTFTDVSVSELQVDGGTVENVTVERLVVQQVEIGDRGTVEEGVFEDVSFDSIQVSGVSIEDIEVQDDDINEAQARGYLDSNESVGSVVIGTLRVDTLSVNDVSVEDDQTGLLSNDSASDGSTANESDSAASENDSMAGESDSAQTGDSNATTVLVREVNVDEMEVDSLTIQTLQQSTPTPSAFDDMEGTENFSLGENTDQALQAIDRAEMAIDANREQFTDEQYVQLKTELANVREAIEDGEVTEEESQELTDSTETIRSTLDESNVSDDQIQGAVDQLPDDARQVGDSAGGNVVVVDAVDVGTAEVESMTTGTTSVRVASDWNSLAVTGFEGPSEISAGETYNVTVTVLNPTNETTADSVSYRAGLGAPTSELVVLEPGETQQVELEVRGPSQTALERTNSPQHIVSTSKTTYTVPVSANDTAPGNSGDAGNDSGNGNSGNDSGN